MKKIIHAVVTAALRFCGLMTKTEHRRVVALVDAELVHACEARMLVTKSERALVSASRRMEEAELPQWEAAEVKQLATFQASPIGKKLAQQMHALAHLELRKTSGAIPGSEARALGHAHGYAASACILENLSALLARDSDEHPEDDEPAGAPVDVR